MLQVPAEGTPQTPAESKKPVVAEQETAEEKAEVIEEA